MINAAQVVRSIAFLDHLLSVGTGNGSIALWDRRKGQYLESPTADLDAVRGSFVSPLASGTSPRALNPQPWALELTGGFLDRNETYTCGILPIMLHAHNSVSGLGYIIHSDTKFRHSG